MKEIILKCLKNYNLKINDEMINLLEEIILEIINKIKTKNYSKEIIEKLIPGRKRIQSNYLIREYKARKLNKILKQILLNEKCFEEFLKFLLKNENVKNLKKEIYNKLIDEKNKNDKKLIDEILIEFLKYSLNEIKFEINYSDREKINFEDKNKLKREFLLLLSDWHILEIVEPEEIGYVNKFDLNVATRRVEKIFEKVVKIKKLYECNDGIRKINVWLGGDMVSGIIHDELIKNVDLTITEQIGLAAYLIAALLIELSKVFNEVNVFTVVGNHGRITKKKEYKKRFNSFDYITYQIAALLTQKYENIKWEITKSPFIFKDILGFRFCFSHGDEIKSWSGIPFYGLRRDFGNKQNINFFPNVKQPNIPMTYYVVGHFHVPAMLYDGTGFIIMNGTLKGVDEYSYSKGWLTRPSQKLLVINEKYGIEATYDLWLDDEDFMKMKPLRYRIDIPNEWRDYLVLAFA